MVRTLGCLERYEDPEAVFLFFAIDKATDKK